MMIKKDRILKEFEELISIDSLSFAERDMADRLKEKLAALGFEVREDNAGAQEDGTAGNIYGYLKGTLPGDPILFSAHMDTVRPGIGKKMFLNEATGKIESGKDTILGADDVTGLVEILEAVREHTSGKGKGALAKIIYIADKIDPGRGYDIRRQKEVCLRDLDEGFALIRKEQQEYLRKEGVNV